MITTCAQRATLRERVARLIGAVGITDQQRMICPGCGGDDFGPTCSLEDLSMYELGWLPGWPLLVGVCMTCGLITHPRSGHDACRPTFAALGGSLLGLQLDDLSETALR